MGRARRGRVSDGSPAKRALKTPPVILKEVHYDYTLKGEFRYWEGAGAPHRTMEHLIPPEKVLAVLNGGLRALEKKHAKLRKLLELSELCPEQHVPKGRVVYKTTTAGFKMYYVKTKLLWPGQVGDALNYYRRLYNDNKKFEALAHMKGLI